MSFFKGLTNDKINAYQMTAYSFEMDENIMEKGENDGYSLSLRSHVFFFFFPFTSGVSVTKQPRFFF